MRYITKNWFIILNFEVVDLHVKCGNLHAPFNSGRKFVQEGTIKQIISLGTFPVFVNNV